MKYRKRPLEVEAHRLIEFVDGGENPFIPEWLMNAFDVLTGSVGSICIIEDPSALQVDFEVVTPHGPIACRFGDWVVQDQFGNLHPYIHEDFRVIFEEVNS